MRQRAYVEVTIRSPRQRPRAILPRHRTREHLILAGIRIHGNDVQRVSINITLKESFAARPRSRAHKGRKHRADPTIGEETGEIGVYVSGAGFGGLNLRRHEGHTHQAEEHGEAHPLSKSHESPSRRDNFKQSEVSPTEPPKYCLDGLPTGNRKRIPSHPAMCMGAAPTSTTTRWINRIFSMMGTCK